MTTEKLQTGLTEIAKVLEDLLKYENKTKEKDITNTTEKKHPFKIGQNYLIRTVTMMQVGKLEEVYDTELVLSKASWIADSGRFHNCLTDLIFDEQEPFVNDIIVGRGAIIDATVWDGDLPLKQK